MMVNIKKGDWIKLKQLNESAVYGDTKPTSRHTRLSGLGVLVSGVLGNRTFTIDGSDLPFSIEMVSEFNIKPLVVK